MINTDTKSIGKSPHTIWIEKGYAYTGGPYKYGEKLNKLEPDDILFVYANRIGVVAIGQVAERWDKKAYYNELGIYPDPKEKMYRIKVRWLAEMGSQPISATDIRAVGGHIIRQTLVRIKEDLARKLISFRRPLEMKSLPEEIDENKILVEGAKKRITINAYERNLAARSICVSHFGVRCQVCGLSFGESYGNAFDGIIHVHHLRKISEIGDRYKIDPVNDLVPVCPNCHAAIHSREDQFTIEEIKTAIQKRRAT